VTSAAGGHLTVLQYLRAAGCDWDQNACLRVARAPAVRGWIERQAGPAAAAVGVVLGL
jgi:hypothetical protein